MFKKIILSCFICFNVFGQEQHQPQDWQEIHTPFVHIIFSKDQKKEAEKIVNTIEYIQNINSISIGNHTHPVDIILRSHTANSNGFVTLSPFRSEFFNTSPQTFNSLGTTDWLSTLAIHEYRHVQQFLNHKTGATNILYYLFGESGWGFGNVMAIPNWYFEGDAVTIETALTQSGRGRIPKFSSLQRAILFENTMYNYPKLRNLSYKDLLPNHYRTGYQMLNYFRNHYDGSTLGNIARSAASFQFPLYPFSYQLKKQTGLSTSKLYKQTVEHNRALWEKTRIEKKTLSYPSITQKNNKVQAYHFPQLNEKGHMIALKTSFDEIPTFYQIDQHGKEQKICSSILNIDSYFEYQNHQILQTGISYHPRYNYTDYNDIFIYDLDSKVRTQITHKKRYFSPSFNADNSKIVAIENNQNHSSLVILEACSGRVLNRIEIDGHLVRPKFYGDHQIVFLKQQNNALGIFRSDLKGNLTQITPITQHTIDNIHVVDDAVYYSASFNGIDNIYATPLDGTKTIKQVTNAHIGAFQPFVSNNRVYFTETLKNGSKISVAELKPQVFKLPAIHELDWNNTKTIALEKGNILDKIEAKTYQSTPYSSSILKDLKLHDWQYFVTNALIHGNITATNLLNDFSLLGSAQYFLNENNSFSTGITASYQKWYPSVNLSLTHTNRKFDSKLIDENNLLTTGTVHYTQTSISPSINIPLSQVKGNYTNRFNFLVGYEFFHHSNESINTDNQKPEYQTLNSFLNFSSIRRTATQHINPHGGFQSTSIFNQTLSGDLDGSFFTTTNRFFFPGLLKTHNSFITLAFRNNSIQQEQQYFNLNPDTFVYARGYQIKNTQNAFQISLNYQLPLFYPDFGLLGITYFKRIRANFFADMNRITALETSNISTQVKSQNSIGFEVIFDNTFFNINQAEIGIGYRGSFLLNDDLEDGGTIIPKNTYVNGIFLSTTLF